MRWASWWCCLLAAGLWGCSGGRADPQMKKVFPVKGLIVVDGKPPMSPIQVVCHNVAGIDQKTPTVSQCDANPDGGFELTTYKTGDGVPPGDYVLTFSWQQFNMKDRVYMGPDKLKDRYSDPKKSEFKFSVKDQPVDLGEFKLTAE